MSHSGLAEVSTLLDRTEVDSLLSLSAEIGRNCLLVQASSGNTSIKVRDTLWIKASGKWLASACKDEILVPVSLSRARECLWHGAPLDESAVQDQGKQTTLHPSIETLMHAALPHRVVVHVHSVNTIAWAIRTDAPAQLAELLFGLRWQWIPYVPSGLPLAQAVKTAAAKDVFVLGNHGLVVCGNGCDEVNLLLRDVERRLAVPSRTAPEFELSVLEQVRRRIEWRIPACDRIHSLATDPVACHVAKNGILYPCQAIFLGRTFPQLAYSKMLSDLLWEPFDCSPFLVLEGSGVLLNPKITAAEYSILEGFAEVLARTSRKAPIRYLTSQEIDAAMGADWFQYRASADSDPKKRSAG